MGLLLSRTHLHGKNNGLQSAFYTDRFFNVICPEVKNYLHHSATLSLLNSMHKQSNSKEIECNALLCFNVCII